MSKGICRPYHSSQRISDFLKSIGKHENVEQFFEAHIKWIKENICDDPAILIDSTGMPDNIHFLLTAISDHNGSRSFPGHGRSAPDP